MLLANGIAFPVLVFLGIIYYGPLILLITTVEWYVIGRWFGMRSPKLFRSIVVANILSTILGAVVQCGQDGILYAAGATESIPAFVRAYRWVGPVVLFAFWVESVVVEGLWLGRRRAREKLNQPRRRVWKAVLVANFASYLLIAPWLFYVNRPAFDGVMLTDNADWTVNPDQIVYYLDKDTRYICRMPLAGGEPRTLVAHPARAFLVSNDENALVFVSGDGSLYAWRTGDASPTLIRESDTGLLMRCVSLSPDNGRLAFIGPNSHQHTGQSSLNVFDLETRETTHVQIMPADDRDLAVTWSADGEILYAWHGDSVPSAFEGIPPYTRRKRPEIPPSADDLVVNYMREQAGRSAHGVMQLSPGYDMKVGDHEVFVYPGAFSYISVHDANGSDRHITNEHGLMNFSPMQFRNAAPLPAGDELLVESWNQTYVLSIPQWKLGLAIPGDGYVLRTALFRTSNRD